MFPTVNALDPNALAVHRPRLFSSLTETQVDMRCSRAGSPSVTITFLLGMIEMSECVSHVHPETTGMQYSIVKETGSPCSETLL